MFSGGVRVSLPVFGSIFAHSGASLPRANFVPFGIVSVASVAGSSKDGVTTMPEPPGTIGFASGYRGSAVSFVSVSVDSFTSATSVALEMTSPFTRPSTSISYSSGFASAGASMVTSPVFSSIVTFQPSGKETSRKVEPGTT